jgi:hypothetical protein
MLRGTETCSAARLLRCQELMPAPYFLPERRRLRLMLLDELPRSRHVGGLVLRGSCRASVYRFASD